jgi:hypothetical protein
MSKEERDATGPGEEQVDPVGLEFLNVAADVFTDCCCHGDGGAISQDCLIALP